MNDAEVVSENEKSINFLLFFYFLSLLQAYCQSRLEYSANILLANFTENNANRLAHSFSSALFNAVDPLRESNLRSPEASDLQVSPYLESLTLISFSGFLLRLFRPGRHEFSVFFIFISIPFLIVHSIPFNLFSMLLSSISLLSSYTDVSRVRYHQHLWVQDRDINCEEDSRSK